MRPVVDERMLRRERIGGCADRPAARAAGGVTVGERQLSVRTAMINVDGIRSGIVRLHEYGMAPAGVAVRRCRFLPGPVVVRLWGSPRGGGRENGDRQDDRNTSQPLHDDLRMPRQG